MTTKTDICNLAIGYAGITTDIDDVDVDQTAEAIQCRRIYQTYLESTLDDFPWSFARATRKLTKMDETDPYYSQVYAFPSDCLSPVSVIREDMQVSDIDLYYYQNPISNVLNDQVSGIKFIKGVSKNGDQRTILTNYEDAYLLYKKVQNDPAVYPRNFIDALAQRIASFLALTLVQSDSKAKTLISMYESTGSNATLRDAQGQNSITQQMSPSARARSY
jgi:hypothetical protein